MCALCYYYRMNATSAIYTSDVGDCPDPSTYELTDPLDHEYEGLNTYGNKQQGHNVAQPLGGQPKAGDYELTQCLAYGAVVHK